MAPVLDEQSRRRYAAMEALSLGHGGVSAMSQISGLARSTINRGLADIRAGASAPTGRIRKLSGGRNRKVIEDPTLLSDLKALVEPCTRGDPMQPLLWTSLSLSAHRRYRLVDQTLLKHRAAEGPADERCHHRLSQCRALLSPNQMCEKLLTLPPNKYPKASRSTTHNSPPSTSRLTPSTASGTISPIRGEPIRRRKIE